MLRTNLVTLRFALLFPSVFYVLFLLILFRSNLVLIFLSAISVCISNRCIAPDELHMAYIYKRPFYFKSMSACKQWLTFRNPTPCSRSDFCCGYVTRKPRRALLCVVPDNCRSFSRYQTSISMVHRSITRVSQVYNLGIDWIADVGMLRVCFVAITDRRSRDKISPNLVFSCARKHWGWVQLRAPSARGSLQQLFLSRYGRTTQTECFADNHRVCMLEPVAWQ